MNIEEINKVPELEYSINGYGGLDGVSYGLCIERADGESFAIADSEVSHKQVIINAIAGLEKLLEALKKEVQS